MLKRIPALLLGLCLLACQGLSLAASIVWMSDTQNYVSGNEELYFAITDWIVQAREDLGIEYVFHTGDVVSASRSDDQWQTAASAMSALTGNGIPFLAVTGNHDAGYPHSYTRFLDYIVSQQTLSFERDFGETGSRYALFSEGGRDYIFLGVSYASRGPSRAETDWANSVLEQHRDRIAIILTHSYIKRSGELTTQGRAVYRDIVAPNANVLLVLCGHARGVSYRTDALDMDGDGVKERTVYAALSNYQDVARGGNGYVRVLQFMRSDIYMYTYSPVLKTYDYAGPARDVAIIPLP